MIAHYNATILGQWQEATSSFWELNPIWVKGPGSCRFSGQKCAGARGGDRANTLSSVLVHPTSPVPLTVVFNVAQVDRRTNRILFSPTGLSTLEFKPIMWQRKPYSHMIRTEIKPRVAGGWGAV